MFGRAPLGRRNGPPPQAAYAVLTSSAVVHSPCAGTLTLNVSPVASIFAGSVVEMRVSRAKDSRV